MRTERSTNPLTFLFLVLPYGISSGFSSVTLPFVLVQSGFSVVAAGSIVALGLSANLWRFAGAPVVDLTLSLRRWYLMGLAACVVTLLLLGLMPLRRETEIILTAVVFLSQVGANL
jgi:MFS transporter, PAT family, beta-lactamase induction signal transducer AmpG